MNTNLEIWEQRLKFIIDFIYKNKIETKIINHATSITLLEARKINKDAVDKFISYYKMAGQFSQVLYMILVNHKYNDQVLFPSISSVSIDNTTEFNTIKALIEKKNLQQLKALLQHKDMLTDLQKIGYNASIEHNMNKPNPNNIPQPQPQPKIGTASNYLKHFDINADAFVKGLLSEQKVKDIEALNNIFNGTTIPALNLFKPKTKFKEILKAIKEVVKVKEDLNKINNNQQLKDTIKNYLSLSGDLQLNFNGSGSIYINTGNKIYFNPNENYIQITVGDTNNYMTIFFDDNCQKITRIFVKINGAEKNFIEDELNKIIKQPQPQPQQTIGTASNYLEHFNIDADKFVEGLLKEQKVNSINELNKIFNGTTTPALNLFIQGTKFKEILKEIKKVVGEETDVNKIKEAIQNNNGQLKDAIKNYLSSSKDFQLDVNDYGDICIDFGNKFFFSSIYHYIQIRIDENFIKIYFDNNCQEITRIAVKINGAEKNFIRDELKQIIKQPQVNNPNINMNNPTMNNNQFGNKGSNINMNNPNIIPNNMNNKFPQNNNDDKNDVKEYLSSKNYISKQNKNFNFLKDINISNNNIDFKFNQKKVIIPKHAKNKKNNDVILNPANNAIKNLMENAVAFKYLRYDKNFKNFKDLVYELQNLLNNLAQCIKNYNIDISKAYYDALNSNDDLIFALKQTIKQHLVNNVNDNDIKIMFDDQNNIVFIFPNIGVVIFDVSEKYILFKNNYNYIGDIDYNKKEINIEEEKYNLNEVTNEQAPSLFKLDDNLSFENHDLSEDDGEPMEDIDDFLHGLGTDQSTIIKKIDGKFFKDFLDSFNPNDENNGCPGLRYFKSDIKFINIFKAIKGALNGVSITNCVNNFDNYKQDIIKAIKPFFVKQDQNKINVIKHGEYIVIEIDKRRCMVVNDDGIVFLSNAKCQQNRNKKLFLDIDKKGNIQTIRLYLDETEPLIILNYDEIKLKEKTNNLDNSISEYQELNSEPEEPADTDTPIEDIDGFLNGLGGYEYKDLVAVNKNAIDNKNEIEDAFNINNCPAFRYFKKSTNFRKMLEEIQKELNHKSISTYTKEQIENIGNEIHDKIFNVIKNNVVNEDQVKIELEYQNLNVNNNNYITIKLKINNECCLKIDDNFIGIL